jgi:hypothetical protein
LVSGDFSAIPPWGEILILASGIFSGWGSLLRHPVPVKVRAGRPKIFSGGWNLTGKPVRGNFDRHPELFSCEGSLRHFVSSLISIDPLSVCFCERGSSLFSVYGDFDPWISGMKVAGSFGVVTGTTVRRQVMNRVDALSLPGYPIHAHTKKDPIPGA